MRNDVKRIIAIIANKSLRPVRAYRVAYFTRAYADAGHVLANTFPGQYRRVMKIERFSQEALDRADALEMAHAELGRRLRKKRTTVGIEKRIKNHVEKIRIAAGEAKAVYDALMVATLGDRKST